MAQQETATDRLVHVIRAIQLGYLTGLLTAKRGTTLFREEVSMQQQHTGSAQERLKSSLVEEGTITFVKGKVTDARLGRLKGSDALNSMSTWGKSVFSFVSSDGSISPSVILPGIPVSSPTVGKDARENSPPLPPSVRPSYSVSKNEQGNSEALISSPTLSANRIPLRLRETDKGLLLIEKMAMSRVHRRLFLLIDGQRPVAELARLMSCDLDTLQKLLQDLEKIAVVKRL